MNFYNALMSFKSPMEGPAFYPLAMALDQGVSAWIPMGVLIEGIATGVGGVGVVTSTKVILMPSISIMHGALLSAGFAGELSMPLANVVANALASAVSTYGTYTGVCSTVAVGTEFSKVTYADGQALAVSLQGAMAGNGISGQLSYKMAQGLGQGIASMLMTATGNGSVFGPAGIWPATGISRSRMILT